MNHPKSMFQLSGVHYTVYDSLVSWLQVEGREKGVRGEVAEFNREGFHVVSSEPA